ncbi:hypothetical protein [Ferrimicrobium sp.]|nr:hypothetical protein [Ferrimicrobium sp.]
MVDRQYIASSSLGLCQAGALPMLLASEDPSNDGESPKAMVKSLITVAW